MPDPFLKELLSFFERVSLFWQSQTISSRFPFIILDILIASALFYWLYVLIHETRAWRIFIGLLLIGVFFIFSRLLGLSVINWIFKNFFAVLVVAIPVVFQPELRSALEKIGRVKLTDFPKEESFDKVIDEITSAVDQLKKSGTGALIVIQRKDGLREYIETGTILNADISAPLILNIFQKRSPLHDGALIISDNKIKAASCLLPIEEKLKSPLGMRHQAAFTLSKLTDALVIVVSEERSEISLAYDGKLKRNLSCFDLKKILLSELQGEKGEDFDS